MATRRATLEYLTTTKIGEKGQLTVPKQFREDLGLGTGAPFAVLRLGDGLVLLPEQQRFEQLCEQVSADSQLCLKRGSVFSRAGMTKLICQRNLLSDTLAASARSDRPAKNPLFPGCERSDGRNRFPVGTG